jgi:hypothetical protein
MYANLILFDKPGADVASAEGPAPAQLAHGIFEMPQFPCWCEFGVVAELSVEHDDAWPSALELRLRDLETDEEFPLASWPVDPEPVRRFLFPHVIAFARPASLGFPHPLSAELSCWVDGTRVGRRCITVVHSNPEY